jgi:hypothetical protein
MPSAPKVSQRPIRAQESIGGNSAQSYEDPGTNQSYLLLEYGQTGLHFIGKRIPISWRPALHHVGDVDLIPTQVDGGQDFGEKLTRGSHEGQALKVFLRSWPLSHQHQIRPSHSGTKDQSVPAQTQAALGAISHLLPETLQIPRPFRIRSGFRPQDLTIADILEIPQPLIDGGSVHLPGPESL